jgi:hypothetical protein
MPRPGGWVDEIPRLVAAHKGDPALAPFLQAGLEAVRSASTPARPPAATPLALLEALLPAVPDTPVWLTLPGPTHDPAVYASWCRCLQDFLQRGGQIYHLWWVGAEAPDQRLAAYWTDLLHLWSTGLYQPLWLPTSLFVDLVLTSRGLALLADPQRPLRYGPAAPEVSFYRAFLQKVADVARPLLLPLTSQAWLLLRSLYDRGLGNHYQWHTQPTELAWPTAWLADPAGSPVAAFAQRRGLDPQALATAVAGWQQRLRGPADPGTLTVDFLPVEGLTRYLQEGPTAERQAHLAGLRALLNDPRYRLILLEPEEAPALWPPAVRFWVKGPRQAILLETESRSGELRWGVVTEEPVVRGVVQGILHGLYRQARAQNKRRATVASRLASFVPSTPEAHAVGSSFTPGGGAEESGPGWSPPPV